ncbi:MAG: NusG domain II-containing protein [Clostridia bacterium]|nr:NusG domain II-containing protein [Clostridia bacterium]
MIFVLLFVAALGILLAFLFRQEGAYCTLTQNGKEIGRYSLSVDREITVYADAQKTAYNTVRIKDGGVSVLAASCPDKICQNSRAIRYHGETVVCLPHGLVITVYSDEDGLDIVV